MNRKRLFVILMLSTMSLTAVGQRATGLIKGFVYEKSSGEPVLFCNVFLEGTNYGTSTDNNGYFVLSNIKDGSYVLAVKYVGYEDFIQKVEVNGGNSQTLKIYLQEAVTVLASAEISAEREEAKTETKTSVIKITPKQIKQMPSIGGQPDLAQYLQVLPGVTFTGDQGGQLYIRGGSPVQNKVLLDGMIIYNPFHSIGLFSVFDTDILSNTEVYTGGFGAEYSGRISSIMDIKTRDGNKKKVSGKIDVNTFAAKLLLEIPLQREKENGKGSSSFILSVKNSYLSQSSKVLYPYANKQKSLPFDFTDIYAKFSIGTKNGSKVNLFGFYFNDRVTDYYNLNYGWESYGGAANFVLVPERTSMVMQGGVSYSYYDVYMKNPGAPISDKRSTVGDFNGHFDFVYVLNKDEFRYGIEVITNTTLLEYDSKNTNFTNIDENSTELGFYAKYKWNYRDKLLLEPSVRIQWYATLGNFVLEPRLAIKYNITNYLRIKAAGGLYSQNLISTMADNEIVNLFSGYISNVNSSLPANFNGKEMRKYLQKAQHVIFGIEADIMKNMSINVEGYLKNFSILESMNRYKIYPDDEMHASVPDLKKKDFMWEQGMAYGLDVTAKYNLEWSTWWLSYSLGWVTRTEDKLDGNNQIYPHTYYPNYDRRHNLNVVASFFIGPAKYWEIDVRYNLGSPFPFTLIQGAYEKPDMNGDVSTDNGDLSILYDDEINTGRLSWYSRLDINFKRKWEFRNRMQFEVNVGCTNLLNRKNIFYYNTYTNEKIYQLPIMPTIGLSFTF